MEERPKYPPSPEDDDDKDDKDKLRKKRSFIAQFIEDNAKSAQEDEKKEKISLDIAKSLFVNEQGINVDQDKDSKSSEEGHESDENKEANPAEPAELTPEEEIYVNREIAERHLEEPVTDEAPAQTVTEFLDMVVEGIKPNDAYSATIRENNLDNTYGRRLDIEPDAISPTPVVIAESLIDSITPSHQEVAVSAQAYRPDNVAQTTATAVARTGQETKPKLKKEKAVAPALTTYLMGKRAGKKSANRESAPLRRRLESKVTEMEQKLSGQEIAIQKLTQENKLRMRQITPELRTQSTVESSRLDLSKPERIENLGKVVIVAAETPKPVPSKERVLTTSNIRKLVKPEEIKTMRRQELLAVSDKIRVEGASLKDMFENNLFGERALRRLVEDYLKGKDIRAELRREIVEREIDFERDPILRDRGRDDQLNSKNPSLFERMLKTVEVPDAVGAPHGRVANDNESKTIEGDNLPQEKSNNKDKSAASPAKNPERQSIASRSIAGAVLSLIIAMLMMLIIYLLLVRH